MATKTKRKICRICGYDGPKFSDKKTHKCSKYKTEWDAMFANFANSIKLVHAAPGLAKALKSKKTKRS